MGGESGSEDGLPWLVFLAALGSSFAALSAVMHLRYGPLDPLTALALLAVSSLIALMGRLSFIRRREMLRRRRSLERALELRRAERDGSRETGGGGAEGEESRGR